MSNLQVDVRKLPIFLSYGLGVDGTAILLRWVKEREARDFDLSELTVITAQVGEEWDDYVE